MLINKRREGMKRGGEGEGGGSDRESNALTKLWKQLVQICLDETILFLRFMKKGTAVSPQTFVGHIKALDRSIARLGIIYSTRWHRNVINK